MDRSIVLVICRNQSLAHRLQAWLDAERYAVRWAPSTARALCLGPHSPDLVLLAVPDSGGERSVARLKRQFSTALLTLSRPGQAPPKGADANLSLQSTPEELAHHVELVLMETAPGTLCASGLALDPRSRRLRLNGRLHELPPIACQILACLMAAPGKAVARDELFRRVWQTHHPDSSRALDVHIARLRRLLEHDPSHPRLILTERGIGYRLNCQ